MSDEIYCKWCNKRLKNTYERLRKECEDCILEKEKIKKYRIDLKNKKIDFFKNQDPSIKNKNKKINKNKINKTHKIIPINKNEFEVKRINKLILINNNNNNNNNNINIKENIFDKLTKNKFQYIITLKINNLYGERIKYISFSIDGIENISEFINNFKVFLNKNKIKIMRETDGWKK